MTGPQMVIVADDLTGAADTGACFACSGLATAVPICAAPPPDVDVLAITTDCRDAGNQDIPTLFHEALRQVVDPTSVRWWFKKIDSALRGSPAVETSLLMNAIGFRRAVIAPALPSEGRVTRFGQILIDGAPLHTTSLGRGLSSSQVTDIFCDYTDLPVHTIGLDVVESGPEALRAILEQLDDGLWIVDAETDRHLLTIAEASTRLTQTLLVGSAGLGRQLASVLPITSSSATPVLQAPGVGEVLVVAGSRHESATCQIDALESTGVTVIRISFGEEPIGEAKLSIISSAIAESLQQGKPTAITTPGTPDSALTGQQIAHDLARIATRPIVVAHVAGMVLTGGDIASEVCNQLNVDHLWLRGEVLPVVPWGTLGGGRMPNLPVVTKAGSFGDDDALVECVRFLSALGSNRD